MKKLQFDNLIREILGPAMEKLGFSYDKMTFFRELSSGVIHLIGLEFDPRTTDTFRVMLGTNSRQIESQKTSHPKDMGYAGAQHLTKSGWSRNSGHWPCGNEQEARASLVEIRRLILEIGEPWFEKFKTLSSVAALLDTEHRRQGLDKAKLFLVDGNRADATKTLQGFLKRLATPKPWDDKNELASYREQAEALLRELE